MTRYFSDLVEQSVVRAKESTLSILSITNPSLRTHLSDLMSSDCGDVNAFLAPPLFESTFGWEFAEPLIEDLEGSLLSKEVISALDSKKNARYRFDKNFHPFKHQLAAWETLLSDEPKSVVVTSGTGSGKTECFMVPVLEDLYREYQAKKAPLVGVRALFLYPLNALINSQQERLNAWS
ncbi:MAG: DEAD/DEAH box helicase, partial [Enterovibrio sp.]